MLGGKAEAEETECKTYTFYFERIWDSGDPSPLSPSCQLQLYWSVRQFDSPAQQKQVPVKQVSPLPPSHK